VGGLARALAARALTTADDPLRIARVNAEDSRRLVRRRAVNALADMRRAMWSARRGERTLDQLGLLHGADKSSAGHDFTRIYEHYVGNWRHRPVTVLEIGVWRGASVRMWRDYFPQGRVFGIDIDPQAAAQTGERIEIFIGDQADTDLLSRVVKRAGALDVVVDDGSHRVEQQLPTLRFLWPHVKPGGIYVVEDTHTSYLTSYGMGRGMPSSTIAALTAHVDDLHGEWHQEGVACNDLDFVHFYAGTCVLGKRAAATHSQLAYRINAAAARRSGAWTG
jgi:cephalosporin hydroxylase